MGGSFLRVVNLDKYQFYTKRNPPWIMLQQHILESYDFGNLPDAMKWHAVATILIASRTDNKIPNDPEWLAGKISAKSKISIQALVDAGFLEYIGDVPDAEVAESEPEKKPKPKKENKEVTEVIEYLNLRTGLNYSPVSKIALKLIPLRLKEGRTVQNFKDVIDNRCKVWLDDAKMKDWLQPSTLFNQEKFEMYLGKCKKGAVNAISKGGTGISDEESERMAKDDIAELDFSGGPAVRASTKKKFEQTGGSTDG